MEEELGDEQEDRCGWAVAVKPKGVFNLCVVNQEREGTGLWLTA